MHLSLLTLFLLACEQSEPDPSTDDALPTDSDTPSTSDTSDSGPTLTGPTGSTAGTGDSGDSGTTPVDLPPLHVLLILVDDLGWTGLSSPIVSEGHHSDYHQTPRMDQLAEEGTVFTRTWAAPVCSPGRAIALTGQHAATTTLYANDRVRGDEDERVLNPAESASNLPSEVTTVAERFRDHGYRTGHFGKWHLGSVADGTDPLSQGFDVNVGGNDEGTISGGWDGHFSQPDGSFVNLPGLGANGQPYQFSTDRIVDEAIDWMLADPSQPTFLHLSPWAVHLPLQSPFDDFARFADLPPGQFHSDPVYAGMMYNLDRNLGRLFDTLEDTEDPRAPGLSLADTTVVVLTSDNGGQGGYAEVGVIIEERQTTNNLPLAGGKGMLYEGGMRVPLIVVGPTVPAAQAIQDPVQLVDVVPTLLDLAGLPSASDLDGDSLVPLIDGEPWDREELHFHFPTYLQADQGTWRARPGSLVRNGRHKLWYDWETRTAMLFDLDADLEEANDIAASEPALVAELTASLTAWLVETDANLPIDQDTLLEVPLPE